MARSNLIYICAFDTCLHIGDSTTPLLSAQRVSLLRFVGINKHVHQTFGLLDQTTSPLAGVTLGCNICRDCTVFDHPRTRVAGAWLARSRRQKSRNPESHRAGKRSRKYNRMKGKKEGKGRKVQCHSGAFPTPLRGDPNHEIRDHLFILLYPFGNHRFPCISKKCYTKIPHSKSQFCTDINQHPPCLCARHGNDQLEHIEDWDRQSYK